MSYTVFPPGFESRIRQSRPDAEQFLASLQHDPVWSVRLHPRRIGHQLTLAEHVPWCNGGYYLSEKPLYTLNPFFHAGHFYPQEASSLFLDYALRHLHNQLPDAPRVLDLCAAPGGKSSLVASFLDGKGLLVSNEVIRSRAWILRENMVKWGYANTVVTQNDPADFGRLSGFFDLMVVDAPCSGEGMFRKDKGAVQEWSVENTVLCAGRQRRILMDAWDALKTGGFLIYSTCTFSPDENELNMQWLQQQQSVRWVKLPVDPQWEIAEVDPVGYGFYPHRSRGEGFYMAIAQKMDGPSDWSPRKEKSKSSPDAPREWLANTDSMKIVAWNSQVVAMPANQAAAVAQIQQTCHILHAGVVLGEPSRKGFLPAAELPFSLEVAPLAFPQVDISVPDALSYLKGNWTAGTPAAGGWNLVVCRGARLGFVKAIGHRMNNYFPKEWRIRMNIDNYIDEE